MTNNIDKCSNCDAVAEIASLYCKHCANIVILCEGCGADTTLEMTDNGLCDSCSIELNSDELK